MVNSLFFEPITENDIQKIILSLNNGAPGYDDVIAQVLKSCVLNVQQPLSYLCNRSLAEGIFPREMKIANMLPLCKSGAQMLFNIIAQCHYHVFCRRSFKRLCTPDY